MSRQARPPAVTVTVTAVFLPWKQPAARCGRRGWRCRRGRFGVRRWMTGEGSSNIGSPLGLSGHTQLARPSRNQPLVTCPTIHPTTSHHPTILTRCRCPAEHAEPAELGFDRHEATTRPWPRGRCNKLCNTARAEARSASLLVANPQASFYSSFPASAAATVVQERRAALPQGTKVLGWTAHVTPCCQFGCDSQPRAPEPPRCELRALSLFVGDEQCSTNSIT